MERNMYNIKYYEEHIILSQCAIYSWEYSFVNKMWQSKNIKKKLLTETSKNPYNAKRRPKQTINPSNIKVKLSSIILMDLCVCRKKI